ncbi:MAG: transporter substrate-binding domain-containing protein [Lachnospiraceae bacterium]|nr:transporter substrate-binding domain-containing protein [Lachnospiraceae bacterium]
MKKLFVSIMVGCMLFLTACGSSAPANTVHSLDDLKGKKIGVQLKTTGDVYSSDIEGADVQRYNKGEDAVLALRKGEVDAVMVDDAPAEVFVAEYGDIKILDEAFADEEYGIAVSKGNTELLDKINKALDTLQSAGTIDKIAQAWEKGEVEKTAYEGQTKEKYANGTLVMATNAEFPPYESRTENDEIIGIDVDIMKAVCDELDMKLQVEHTSFDSIFASVERGMADVGVAAITITEERLKKFDFSKPYVAAKQVIIVRGD